MDKINRHSQFPLQDDIVYFNHAAVSPWPLCAVEAIEDFSRQNLVSGSKNYLKWMETEQNLREMMQWLINAESSDDIALLKNTSEGLSVIAYGIDWQAGDNVVIPASEFPSNRIVWESLRQFDVEIRQIDIYDCTDPEAELLNACDDKTRVLSVSAVQYADGFRLDLAKIGGQFREKCGYFVVDAIQQLGALKFDNQQIQADFIIADGHKWMMGPEGLALFYSHPKARESLILRQYGWRMIENPADFSQTTWKVAKSAKRFECGSPNMLAIAALHASLGLIRQLGIENIQEIILSNTNKLMNYIDNNENYILLTSADPKRLSGIVCFRHKRIENADLFAQLTRMGIQCAERGGGVRLSPHFYHTNYDFNHMFSILDGI